MGGTAVGTGLNAPPGFGEQVAAEIASMTGIPFKTAPNKFTAQATLDRMVRAHGGLKAAAVTLFKIANDLRWLGSGPRTGLHELILPSNEPGSSIMPGKVNPTQAEAMLMVAIQVIASDVAVTMGGAEGNFELNAFRPILIDNYLHSALIMADMCDHFREFMVQGTELNQAKLKREHRPVGHDGHRAVPGHRLRPGLSRRPLRHRPQPDPQAGRPGQRRQRGPLRPGRQPARPDPRRISRPTVWPRPALT